MPAGIKGSSPPCTVDGCLDKSKTRSLCNKHYQRWRKYSDPTYTQDDRDLWIRIERIGWVATEAGCWEWQGYVQRSGYGIITVHYKRYRVHVQMLERSLGRNLKVGYQANHHCDNRKCCNPDHLYEGTHDDNMRDVSARGRHGTKNIDRMLQCLTDTEFLAKMADELTRRAMSDATLADVIRTIQK